MHVLFIDIWMTVSDYNTNLNSNYTSWDWNLDEMHVCFIGIWMPVSEYNTNLTVSDYNTNPRVIILVGIRISSKCMFLLLVSGGLYQIIIPIATVITLVGIGIWTK